MMAKRFNWLILSLVFSISCLNGQETIHFTTGASVQADVLTVSRSSVSWKVYLGDGTINRTPVSQIKSIKFQPSEEWASAEGTFSRGEYNEAGKLFSAIALNKNSNYYPIPGNRSSLALKRILDCHRRLLNAKKFSEIARTVYKEIKTLPPEERLFSDAEKAWVAAGEGNWKKVLEITDGEGNKKVGSEAVELSFLSAKAHVAMGSRDLAIDGFTNAYAFGFGTHPEIARLSVKGAAELLSTLGDEDRAAELQSQLKIYQELFGNGKLWSGAAEELVELAKADLDTFDFSGAAKALSAPAMSALPADLPPLKDRNWYLAIETDKPVYVPGLGEFEGKEGPSSPERIKNYFSFNGKNYLSKNGVAMNQNYMHLKAIVIPQEKDGLILTAGQDGIGMTLFIRGGRVKLAWHSSKRTKKEFDFGPIEIGTETIIIAQVNPLKTLSGRASPGINGRIGEVPAFISLKNKQRLILAPSAEQDAVTEYELPRFKGIVRHFSVGFAPTASSYAEAEKKLFNGKAVKLAVPKVQKSKAKK